MASRISRGSGAMEILKFGVYVGFPLFCMTYFGDPEWYNRNVAHMVPAFTKADQVQKTLPRNPEELRQKIAELKEERKRQRLEMEAWQENPRWSSSPPTPDSEPVAATSRPGQRLV